MRGLHYIAAASAQDKAVPWWLPPPITVLHLWSPYPISLYPNSFRWTSIFFRLINSNLKSLAAHTALTLGMMQDDTLLWWCLRNVYEKWNSWLRRSSQVIPSHFEDPGHHQLVTHSKSFSSNTCNTKQNHTVHTRNTTIPKTELTPRSQTNHSTKTTWFIGVIDLLTFNQVQNC